MHQIMNKDPFTQPGIINSEIINSEIINPVNIKHTLVRASTVLLVNPPHCTLHASFSIISASSGAVGLLFGSGSTIESKMGLYLG